MLREARLVGLSFLLVVLGTITSLSTKSVYQVEGVGRDGEQKLFEKPWALTTVMCFAMALCLPLAHFTEPRAEDVGAWEAVQPLLLQPPLSPRPATNLAKLRKAAVLAIPATFDLVAIALMNVGLLHLRVSVHQMLRGASELLFARIFAAAALKKRPTALHLGGSGLCVLGVAVVGAASMLAGGSGIESGREQVLGMGLVVLSQGVQLVQTRYMDMYMADLSITPLRMVGYEGLFGMLGMLGFVLPLLQLLPGTEGRGLHEDSLDTLHMIAHSPTLLCLLLSNMVALFLYNVAGMAGLGRLGAVLRTLLESLRTLCVWLGALLLYYYAAAGSGKLGEPWGAYSWLQAAGFVVLVGGTLLYSKGDERRVREQAKEEAEFFAGEAEAEAGAGSGEQGELGLRLEGQDDALLSPAPSASVPMAVAAASFKSSMNLSAFNLPRGLTDRIAEEGGLCTTPRPTWVAVRASPFYHQQRGRPRKAAAAAAALLLDPPEPPRGEE